MKQKTPNDEEVIEETVNSLPVPALYQKIFKKAQKSKAYALKAACLACTNFQRKVVQNCGVPACPMFTHRPYQKNRKLETDDKAH